jgi:fructokinase
MNSNSCLCIYGEVLFDHFPAGARVLGGAPFNVAWHLQAFKQAPCFISRVGDDPEGKVVRDAMLEWGMRTDALQVDPQRPTGRVSVSFVDGEPEYDIVEQCAYDAIAAEQEPLACRLFYHGSLALREHTSHRTAQQLKAADPDIVFVDVNLRPPWWRREQVVEMIKAADWVKLNSDELKLIYPAADASAFMDDYNLNGLVLTHGAAGAEILTASGEHVSVQPVATTSVVDTVGAGDAFASVIILGLANDWPLEITAQRAQAFASGLVGRRGATVSDKEFYRDFIDVWWLES